MLNATQSVSHSQLFCGDRPFSSALMDGVLVIGCVVFSILGILGSLAIIAENIAMFSGCMYGVAFFCLVAAILKQVISKNCYKQSIAIDSDSPTQANAGQIVDDEKTIIDQAVPNHTISTSLTLSKWLCGFVAFDGPDKARPLRTRAYNLSADRLLHPQKESVLFNKKGIVSKPGSETLIDFTYTPLLELIGEEFDEKPLRDILTCFIKQIKRKTIPKLFISTAVAPEIGIPHALLLVIEPHPKDLTQARITLIDSFGASTGYSAFKKKLEKIALQFFPSHNTTCVRNSVCQQEDGWSCGWHMLANVELLSKQSNVQEFVINKRYPKRDIDQFWRVVYEQHIVPASQEWNRAVTKDKREPMLYRQFEKKCLTGDPNGNCKEWCEKIIENGFQLTPNL